MLEFGIILSLMFMFSANGDFDKNIQAQVNLNNSALLQT